MYVQVNFGRNIGTTPMAAQTWLKFQSAVLDALYEAANSVPKTIFDATVEMHYGTGSWYDGDELVREDSAHFSFFDPAGFGIEYLKNELSEIGRVFGQETIGVIVGSELINSND